MTRHLGLGGMERQLAGLAVMLREHGHEVSVLTYRPGADFFGTDLAGKGVKRVRFLRKKCEPTLSFEKRLAGFFRETGPDAVIAYGQAASRKAAVAHLFFPGFKLIVSERTANPRLNIFDVYKSILYRKSANLLITNSYAQRDQLTGAFPSLGKMTVTVPNFIDASLFHPAQDAAQRNKAFTIVTTSRVSPRKNTARYIKAVKAATDRGADVLVKWYGRRPNSGKYCRKCDALIERLGLKDRFLLLESVDKPELVYREADAFCLPSHYEGTSNSLAEALASGLPVICSGTGDNTIYVKPGENGFLFDSRNMSGIADAIVKIAATPAAELEKMSAASRKTVTEKLSFEKFSDSMEKILGSL